MRGADLVLIAMQSLWARGRVSNNTLLVVQCDAPIAPERIRRALDRFLGSCPWPAARLRRPFPWGKLHWAAGPPAARVPPPVRRRSVASYAELHRELEAELNSPIDPRRDPPLRFLLVDCGREPGDRTCSCSWPTSTRTKGTRPGPARLRRSYPIRIRGP